MASFDDLAFRSTASRATPVATPVQLFCRDCNEVAQQTTDDRKRCLICGCELEDRTPHALDSGTRLAGDDATTTTPHDLQALIERMFASLGDADHGFGTESDSRRPASSEAVHNLGSFIADQASTIEVAIVAKGVKGEVVAVPANFGPCTSIEQRALVVAEPLDGASPFTNATAMVDKIVVMTRGACTFAAKVRRAQAAGAVAVVIIQTLDVWPYTMTDSSNSESAGITIPAFMLSAKHGSGFVAFLRKRQQDAATTTESNVVADIVVRRDARECVICQNDLSIGMTVTRMPCQWLEIGNSCPICRVEIPAKKSARHGTFVHQTAQQRGDFAWNDWFS